MNASERLGGLGWAALGLLVLAARSRRCCSASPRCSTRDPVGAGGVRRPGQLCRRPRPRPEPAASAGCQARAAASISVTPLAAAQPGALAGDGLAVQPAADHRQRRCRQLGPADPILLERGRGQRHPLGGRCRAAPRHRRGSRTARGCRGAAGGSAAGCAGRPSSTTECRCSAAAPSAPARARCPAARRRPAASRRR